MKILEKEQLNRII